MLKWIGGMQAFLLVMGLMIASSILGVFSVIPYGYNNDIYPWFVYFSLLVFGAYALVMAIWVMPAIKKEEEEKRQVVLDKNAKLIDDTVDKVNVVYHALMDDLEEMYSIDDVVVIINEIHSRTALSKGDENEK